MTTLTAPQSVFTATESHLSPTISGLNWLQQFSLGGGLDAITGDYTTASALADFEVRESSRSNQSLDLRIIQNENEFSREIETSASGSYNFDGVQVGASAEFIDKISFSELSLTVLVHHRTGYEGYDQIESPALSDEAKKRAASDPAGFRSQYGDYFISGHLRGSNFVGLYTCTAKTSKNAQEFSASLSAETPELFTAEGAVKFEQMAEKHDVEISVSYTSVGASGTPPVPQGDLTPQTLLEIYEWFLANETGVPIEALLTHYSILDPALPSTVPVAPAVFTELREMYQDRWLVRALYRAVPVPDELRSRFNHFDDEMTSQTAELATDAALRQQLATEGRQLLADLNDISQRQAFFALLAGAHEPKQGEMIYEKIDGQQTWAFGFSSWHDPAVAIHHTYQAVAAKGKAFKKQKKTLEVGPSDGKLMVGWSVEAYWNDGTDGHFSKAVERIIGTDHAAVFFASLGFRGYHWGLTVYWVDAADYQF